MSVSLPWDWSLWLALHLLPEAERHSAKDLLDALNTLDRYAKQFGTDLALFDFSASNDKQGWDFIAARDGAITVYNFRKMLDRVTSLLHLCPTLQAKTSREKLRLLKNKFDHRIPAMSVRSGVAHAAEFAGALKSHALLINKAFVYLSNNLQGRKYIATVNKRVVTYDISSATLDLLNAITQELREYITAAWPKNPWP